MNYTTEQLTATNQANIQALQNMATQIFSGVQKLVELNVAAAKATLSESLAQTQGVMSIRDPKQLMTLPTNTLQPLLEKAASYNRHVYNIATTTSAELNKTLSALVENVVTNAPANVQSAVAFVKTNVSAGQKAMETAQSAVHKAVDMVETNMTAATTNAFSKANQATTVYEKA